MTKIIKLPERYFCEGCGKPLIAGEGVLCPEDGCEAVGCRVCYEGSPYCLDHIAHDPDYGRG